MLDLAIMEQFLFISTLNLAKKCHGNLSAQTEISTHPHFTMMIDDNEKTNYVLHSCQKIKKKPNPHLKRVKSSQADLRLRTACL